MDLVEAIKARKSIRGYKDDPVPQEILRKILEVATCAPSADNSQPWEITVITGKILKDIAEANVEALNSGRPIAPDVTHKPYEGIYRKRQMEVGKKIFELMDIPREDKVKRNAWILRGFRFFDAPAAFLLAADESLDPTRAASDIGGIAQTICLVAQTLWAGNLYCLPRGVICRYREAIYQDSKDKKDLLVHYYRLSRLGFPGK